MNFPPTLCLLLFAFVHSGSGQETPDGPDMDELCEDCGNRVEDCLTKMSDPLKKDEPLTMKNVGKCEECNVTDIYTLKKDGRICPIRQNDGSNIQDMEIGFDNVHAECICTIKDRNEEEVVGSIICDWNKARFRIFMKIKDGKAAVVKSNVNCDNPMPKCNIAPNDLDAKCYGDEKFSESCENLKHIIAIQVMTNVVEAAFPSASTKVVNEHPDFIRDLNCEDS